jgi:hypothetical protein
MSDPLAAAASEAAARTEAKITGLREGIKAIDIKWGAHAGGLLSHADLEKIQDYLDAVGSKDDLDRLWLMVRLQYSELPDVGFFLVQPVHVLPPVLLYSPHTHPATLRCAYYIL